MADYYSILEKTISGLPNNTPEVRTAVYKKARTAIETQLRNLDPTPSEEAINAQLQLLEEAIVLIDVEYGTDVAQATGFNTPPPTAELPPEPEAPEQDTPEPQVPTYSEPEPEVQPQPQPQTQPETETSFQAPPETVHQSPQAPASVAPQSVDEIPEAIVERAEVAVDAIPATQADMGDPVAVSSEVSSNTPQVDNPSISVDPDTRDILSPIIDAGRTDGFEQAAPLAGSEGLAEEKSSGVGGFIKLLVVLGILGGAGFAIWKNKDELTNFATSLFGGSQVESTDVSTNNETSEPEVETPKPEVAEDVAPPAPEVEEPVEPEVVEPETATQEPVEETPVEETQTAETTSPEAAPEENTQQSGVIPIGEVAYLYEEGVAGSGASRTNAAVTWELRQESLRQGLPAEPVIIGKMDVPEKSFVVDIKIKRNVDEAVSASHLIEMRFNLPEDFTGKTVESIARFVMKATEEAPGEPLVAVPVKVTEGNFLIALDNLQQAVTVNTQLLREAAWIDIPLVYGTGKRALLTLEKGGTGERVFTQAFADWQNR